MESYLKRYGYKIIETIPQDASSRQYFRIIDRKDKTAIFMKDNPHETRIGHRTSDFIRVALWLREIGLSAPQIYDVDEEKGFAVIEDLGKTDFRRAMERGHSKKELYHLAHDVLKFWADKLPDFPLPDYYESSIHHLHRDVVNWYVPFVREQKNPDGLAEDYWEIWEGIEKKLPPCPKGFMHIDYHIENLMWMPERQGLKRCGLLDFQAANWGPLPYDLVNLLEDARADVPQDIQDEILKGYDEDFLAWYRVLGTQFHCRVIGLFIKLPVLQGKMKYLEHIPRMCRYLQKDLQNPILKPVKEFFDDWGVDFAVPDDINIENVMAYVRTTNQ